MRTPTLTTLIACDTDGCGTSETIERHPAKAGAGDITEALRALGWTVRDSRCPKCRRPDPLAGTREFCPACTEAGKVGE